jgi:lipopolysaccharide export system protein LptA
VRASRTLTLVAVSLPLALAAVKVWGKETAPASPIQVYANSIDIDDRTGIAWYRGDVAVTDGTFSLKADSVEVKMQNGEIEVFRAFGKPVNVEHRSPETHEVMRAKADRATYNVKTQKLDMFDNVRITQQDSELRCAQVHYDLEARRFLGKGNAQARCYMTFQPVDQPRGGASRK